MAKFAEKHLPVELEKNASFREGNYEKALVETFLKVDAMLLTPEGKKQVKEFQRASKQEDVEEQSYAGDP